MPREDKSGPMGAGPRTGKGAGHCADISTSGHTNRMSPSGLGLGFGRGMGPGRGMGRRRGPGGGVGREHRAVPEADSTRSRPEDERRALEGRREMLQRNINSIEERLEQLEAQGDVPQS